MWYAVHHLYSRPAAMAIPAKSSQSIAKLETGVEQHTYSCHEHSLAFVHERPQGDQRRVLFTMPALCPTCNCLACRHCKLVAATAGDGTGQIDFDF